MNYASLSGLESHMGNAAFAEWKANHSNAQSALESCEARLLAYILPRRPEGDELTGEFSRAVYAQIEHEASPACMQIADMPEGVKSFSVNGFSAAMDEKRSRICETARAILLNAGLLYRGTAC